MSTNLNRIKDPSCHECGAPCSPRSDRIFIKHNWFCGSCVYKMEYGEKAAPESLEKPKRSRAKKQQETLFDGYRQHRDVA